MKTSPEIDEAQAHRHFAKSCFYRAWDLMQKPERPPEEDEEMLLLAYASLWHWSQREECTDRNLSVGYWQLSRIFSLLGEADNALRCGELALEYGEDEPPFYKAYAHEAVARASKLAGNRTEYREHLSEARRLAEEVEEGNERLALERDLDELG